MLSVTVSDLKRREAYTRQWQDSDFSSDSEQDDEQRSSKDNVFDKQSKEETPVRSESFTDSLISQSSHSLSRPKRKRKRGLQYCYSHTREFDYNYHSSEESSEEEDYTHVPTKRKRDDKEDSETSAQDSDSGESITSSVEEQHSQQPFKNVVSLDCETVSCIPNSEWEQKANPLSGRNKKRKKHSGRKEVSVAAHCAIVGYDYKVLYNSRISTDMEVTNWRGMNSFCFLFAPPFSEARKRILSILKDKIVVVHDAKQDMRYLQIRLNRDIPSGNIRDTAECSLLRKKANEAGVSACFPAASLKDLAKDILKRTIHKKGPHDPVEDAKVAMELYRCVEEEWESRYSKGESSKGLHPDSDESSFYSESDSDNN